MQIRKRKDTGKWGYQICFHSNRYRLSGWNTRDEAQKAAEDHLGKLRREASLAASGSNMACVDAVNGFLAYSARIGKSENRLRGLYSNFHSFILPFFTAQKRLKDITHNDIESFIDEQCKRDISKNTITHYVTDLNAMLNWAVKEEFLFFRFLLFTGERLTEALSSKWTDVNYENREIIIRGTKTEGSLRRLDMCDGLYMTLKELEAYKTDSPYIFHHSNGKRILRRDKLFVKIKESTGIKITAKDLRDVFASTIAMGSENNRPDVQTVSDLLGHTNLITTKKYLYSLKEKRMKAVCVLDDIYGTENGTEIKKDLEKLLSPCYHGGGAGNRTPDTTDMSRML